MTPISEGLKKAAVAAFRDNAKLALISDADREVAAAFYEWVAGDTGALTPTPPDFTILRGPGSCGGRSAGSPEPRTTLGKRSATQAGGRVMFKFREGDVISILKDVPELDLKAGDKGVVWALYDINPPAYEATFWPAFGDGFDMTVYEEEVGETGLTRPVFERPVFETELVELAV